MKRTKLKFDKYEPSLIIKVLGTLQNDLISQNKGHDFVDELILRLCD